MAKWWNVCEASRGTLSSYSFLILLIHYLQRVKVLPHLQELGRPDMSSGSPRYIYNGFDTWFQDDFATIRDLFQINNAQNCSKLWIGFLQYYLEHFNFETNVIQIRTRADVSKDAKEWYSPIAIEDPFELSHNLGRNVSRISARRIVDVFQYALRLATAEKIAFDAHCPHFSS